MLTAKALESAIALYHDIILFYTMFSIEGAEGFYSHTPFQRIVQRLSPFEVIEEHMISPGIVSRIQGIVSSNDRELSLEVHFFGQPEKLLLRKIGFSISKITGEFLELRNV